MTLTRSWWLAGVAVIGTVTVAYGHTADTTGDGPIALLGRYHPVLVHFPVALVVGAAVAEVVYMMRARQSYGDAARFMINLAVVFSVLTAVAGFMAASGKVYSQELQGVFNIHRVAGVATPVLVLLAAGLCEGVRRSGQVWEQMLYRVILLLAVVSVAVAGYHGGELVYGAGYFWW